ncbi:MAG: FecR domain-containing protein [bacterium]|nr:FecR domain-containing protein [bacterium]
MLIMADADAVPDPRNLDRLGPHQRAFNAWVAENPSRQLDYLRVVKTVQQASKAAVQTYYRGSLPRQTRKVERRQPRLLLAASVALCLLVATGLLWRSTDTPPSLIGQSEARTPLETRVGEVRTERLEDGSSILLDTDTLVLIGFTADRRTIELKRGRARFTVARQTERPFMVHGRGVDVTAGVGQFDMTIREGTRVHAIEGEVNVTLTHAVAGAGAGPRPQPKALTLNPGQLLTLKAGQFPDFSINSAKRSEQQWVSGVKSYDYVPISDVIAEANSYSETKILLAQPSLGTREIFADIEIRNIERVAKALSGFLNLRIERTQKNILLLTAKNNDTSQL